MGRNQEQSLGKFGRFTKVIN